jgi:hypothetical protein
LGWVDIAAAPFLNELVNGKPLIAGKITSFTTTRLPTTHVV